MHLSRLSALALSCVLFAFAAPTTAHADQVPADAYYLTDCLPSVSCTGLVERTGNDAWKLEWFAVDRNANEVICRHEATLRLGEAEHRDVTLSGVLHGKLDGGPHDVIVMALGGDQVWMYTESDVCPGVKVPNGIIVLAGNYDMEIGDI